MERLKNMKETLMGCVQGQMCHLEAVDTKELGEAIDMIKDLSEAIYYCTITEAMEEKEEEGKEHHYYYTERMMPAEHDYRMMDRDNGRMYYNGNGNGNGTSSNGQMNGNGNGVAYYPRKMMMYHDGYDYYEREMPFDMRDEREGRSHLSRKTYMESKEMHQDKNVKLKELEKYMQELTTDMVEMIQGASPEEKQLLEKRISALATKIGQVNG